MVNHLFALTLLCLAVNFGGAVYSIVKAKQMKKELDSAIKLKEEVIATLNRVTDLREQSVYLLNDIVASRSADETH